jgi:hypothetical protein
MCVKQSAILLILISIFICPFKCQFLIDQRFKEQQKILPPPNPFFNTFYDKSYYLTGAQKPVYHVIFILNFFLILISW